MSEKTPLTPSNPLLGLALERAQSQSQVLPRVFSSETPAHDCSWSVSVGRAWFKGERHSVAILRIMDLTAHYLIGFYPDDPTEKAMLELGPGEGALTLPLSHEGSPHGYQHLGEVVSTLMDTEPLPDPATNPEVNFVLTDLIEEGGRRHMLPEAA